jgi:LysR family transcriptional activator of nhaA
MMATSRSNASLQPAPRLVCLEGPRDALLRDLTARRLDAVLSPDRAPAGLKPPVMSRELMAGGLAAFATHELAQRHAPGFPASLDGAPLLLPSTRGEARAILDDWFASRGISPHIVGEFDDAALREAFGEQGVGIFFAPTMIEEDLCRRYNVERLGDLPDLTARIFLLTPATGTEHPAIATMLEALSPSG